jgi:hypothetical protein
LIQIGAIKASLGAWAWPTKMKCSLVSPGLEPETWMLARVSELVSSWIKRRKVMNPKNITWDIQENYNSPVLVSLVIWETFLL